MKPSEMRSIMHAYSAVHSTDVKKELDSGRDQISEMRLTQLTDSDLVEVAEEILEGLFAAGFSVSKTQSLLEAVLIASDIPGRQQKIERLQEAFITVVSKVKEKSARSAIESFAEYRHSKSVNEAWVNKFETDRGNARLHESLVAQDRLTVKTGLLQMLEKAKAETPAAEEEEERKDDELFGSPNKKKAKKKSKDVKEDKKYGYDKKGRSLNPADVEERKRKKDDLFGSPNVKKEETELAEKQRILLIRSKQLLLMTRRGKVLMMQSMILSMARRSRPRKNVTMLSGNVIREQKMLRSQVILGNMLRDLPERKKVRRVKNMLT